MAETYQFTDINASGDGMVEAAFDNQVAYCSASDARITARVVAAVRDLLAAGEQGALFDALRGWKGAPLADALPLRVAGGLHSLHLGGRDADLSRIYGIRQGPET